MALGARGPMTSRTTVPSPSTKKWRGSPSVAFQPYYVVSVGSSTIG